MLQLGIGTRKIGRPSRSGGLQMRDLQSGYVRRATTIVAAHETRTVAFQMAIRLPAVPQKRGNTRAPNNAPATPAPYTGKAAMEMYHPAASVANSAKNPQKRMPKTRTSHRGVLNHVAHAPKKKIMLPQNAHIGTRNKVHPAKYSISSSLGTCTGTLPQPGPGRS